MHKDQSKILESECLFNPWNLRSVQYVLLAFFPALSLSPFQTFKELSPPFIIEESFLKSIFDFGNLTK